MGKITIIDKAIIEFENALSDLEALNDYFIETSKLLQQKRLTFQNEYCISLELMEILDKIYEVDPEKRNDYITSIQDSVVVGNIPLKNIIKLSISDEDVIQFSMKDGFEK